MISPPWAAAARYQRRCHCSALHADRCQIFTDVEGVYTADPRKVRNTRKLEEITFDEMLELASLGAQVLNNRSVELAKKYNVELEVLSSLNPVPVRWSRRLQRHGRYADQGCRKGHRRCRYHDSERSR